MATEITSQAQLEELQNSGQLMEHLKSWRTERDEQVAKEATDALLAKQQSDRTPAGGRGGFPMGESPDMTDSVSGMVKGGWHGYDPLETVPAGGTTPRAVSRGLNGQFDRFGTFLAGLHPTVRDRHGLDGAKYKVLGEGQGDQGGFLVPEQFVANLLSIALEEAVVRPRAFQMPMGGPSVRIPAIRDASHATNVYGGVQAFWVPESGTVTAAEPTFAQVALNAKKLTGYTTTSSELLNDSAIPLEALITRLFGDALAYFEDEAFINGTGSGDPQGIINTPAMVSVAKETGQAATTIVTENLDKMYSRMLPSSMMRSVWLAHPDVFPQLASLARNVGTGGAPVWIANVAGGPPNSIYGRPLIFTEKCQTLGTTGDIYFCDFSYYVIGDLQGMTMAASPHVRFTNDEWVYRFTHRVDGRAWVDTALTPRYGSNTLSPFVKLDSR